MRRQGVALTLCTALLGSLLGLADPAVADEVAVTVSVDNNLAVAVNDDATADLHFTVAAPSSGPFAVSWWFEDAEGVVQPTPTGAVESVTFTADEPQTFGADLTGLREGDWVLRVHLAGAADQGTSAAADGAFTVTHVAPHVTVSPVTGTTASGTFYPFPDYYYDRVSVTMTSRAAPGELTYWLEVRDATDTVVRTIAQPYEEWPTKWNGRDDAGVLVAPGTYRLRGYARDSANVQSSYDAGQVRVSPKYLETRISRRTVTAASTLVDKYVGACSVLRKPSLRGWKGSLGLYSNTKCRKTQAKSRVMSVHTHRIPRAVKYVWIKFTAYGGAAKSAPNSYGSWGQLDINGKWHWPKGGAYQLDPALTSHFDHENSSVSPYLYIWPDRSFVWAVYMANGARYDLKSFTFRVKYKVLVG